MNEKELRERHKNLPYRKTNDTTLGNVIKSLVQIYGLSHKLYEAQIKVEWALIVGVTIAKYTTGISLREETLYLQVRSASLKQELLFSKRNIINAVNKHIGRNYISHIVFY